jgi:hypothetical protein
MITLVQNIVAIVNKLIPSREQTRAKKILAENLALEAAIKRGDMEEVERIRQRKQSYSKLFAFLCLFLIMGCGTTKAPPILGDLIPVRLEIGQPVKTVAGEVITIQSNKNTLVSDAYVYQSVTSQDVDEKKK